MTSMTMREKLRHSLGALGFRLKFPYGKSVREFVGFLYLLITVAQGQSPPALCALAEFDSTPELAACKNGRQLCN